MKSYLLITLIGMLLVAIRATALTRSADKPVRQPETAA
jgi:hypothetical protein